MVFDRIKYAIDYFKYLDNPIEGILFKFGIKDEFRIKLKKSDESIRINNIATLDIIMRVIKHIDEENFPEFILTLKDICNNENTITINDINYLNLWSDDYIKTGPNVGGNVCLFEYFGDDEWSMVNFKDRDVIDIGANVADTPLFFAKKGANVIGFEPVKELYEIGLKNINLNPAYKEQIKLINKGVGAKRGKIKINEEESVTDYVNENFSYYVEVITIEDILNDYDIKPDILKMDCEGCEFKIILNNDLSEFKDIIFEYHSFMTHIDYKELVVKLEEQDFNIDLYEVNSTSKSVEEIGIIHAHKD